MEHERAFEVTEGGGIGMLVTAWQAAQKVQNAIDATMPRPRFMHPAGYDSQPERRNGEWVFVAQWGDNGPEVVHEAAASAPEAKEELRRVIDQQIHTMRRWLDDRRMKTDEKKAVMQMARFNFEKTAIRAVFPHGLSVGGQPLTWTGGIQSWDDYDHQRKEKA